jgi:hypothetical protein
MAVTRKPSSQRPILPLFLLLFTMRLPVEASADLDVSVPNPYACSLCYAISEFAGSHLKIDKRSTPLPSRLLSKVFRPRACRKHGETMFSELSLHMAGEPGFSRQEMISACEQWLEHNGDGIKDWIRAVQKRKDWSALTTENLMKVACFDVSASCEAQDDRDADPDYDPDHDPVDNLQRDLGDDQRGEL